MAEKPRGDRAMRVELVTNALKRCVGYGATAERVVNLAALRELVPITDHRISPVAHGSRIVTFLEEAIASFDAPVQWHDAEHAANKLRACFRLELRLSQIGWSAPRRRAEVLSLLGVGYTVASWSQPWGPERSFLRMLARRAVCLGDELVVST